MHARVWRAFGSLPYNSEEGWCTPTWVKEISTWPAVGGPWVGFEGVPDQMLAPQLWLVQLGSSSIGKFGSWSRSGRKSQAARARIVRQGQHLQMASNMLIRMYGLFNIANYLCRVLLAIIMAIKCVVFCLPYTSSLPHCSLLVQLASSYLPQSTDHS